MIKTDVMTCKCFFFPQIWFLSKKSCYVKNILPFIKFEWLSHYFLFYVRNKFWKFKKKLCWFHIFQFSLAITKIETSYLFRPNTGINSKSFSLCNFDFLSRSFYLNMRILFCLPFPDYQINTLKYIYNNWLLGSTFWE